VHGGKQGLLDTEVTVEDFHQRGDVVGGATRAGDDLCGAIGPVDTVDDGRHVRALGRAGQDHPGRTGPHVFFGVVAVGEQAGALQHQVDLEVGPREPLRVALAQVHQRLAVDDKLAVEGLDLPLVTPVHGVVLEQVHHVVEGADLVDGYELELGLLQHQLERRPADTAEPVDRHLAAHALLLSLLGRGRLSPNEIPLGCEFRTERRVAGET
jgi:hypothetical protein